MDRQKVVYIPATCLFLILLSSSYVKFDICMLHRYFSLLPEGGLPGEKTAPAGIFIFSGFLRAPAKDGA
jgi:hypothetical protein